MHSEASYARCIQLLVLLASLAGPCPATGHAREAGAELDSGGADAEQSRLVTLEVAGSSKQVEALRPVLLELLGRIGAKPRLRHSARIDPAHVVTPDPKANPAVARVWIDFNSTERVSLFLTDGNWEQVLIRRLPASGRSTEVLAEELAAIVLAGVETLLSGGRVGEAREEVERSLGVVREAPRRAASDAASEPVRPAPASPTPPPHRALAPGWVLRLGAAAGVELLAEPEPFQPTLAVTTRVSRGSWAGFFDAGASRSVSVETPDVLLALREYTLLAGLSRDLTGSARFATSVDLGFGSRFTRQSSVRPEGSLAVLEPARLSLDPVAMLRLAATLRLSSRLDGWLCIGGYFDLRSSSYFIRLPDGDKRTIFSPYRARPLVKLGLLARFE